MLERERPGHPEATLAHAVDGELVRVDVGSGEEGVHEWSQDGLPVRPRRDSLFDERGLLPRAVVQHDVVAPLERSRRAGGPQRTDGAVASVGHDERRSPAHSARRTEQPTRKCPVLVGNGEPLDRWVEQVAEGLPAPAVRGERRTQHGPVPQTVGRRQGQGEVGTRTQVRRPRAHPVAGEFAPLRDGAQPFARPEPGAEPARGVAVLDGVDRREDLTRVRAAVDRRAERDPGVEIEPVVCEESPCHPRPPPDTPARPARCRSQGYRQPRRSVALRGRSGTLSRKSLSK